MTELKSILTFVFVLVDDWLNLFFNAKKSLYRHRTTVLVIRWKSVITSTVMFFNAHIIRRGQ